MAKHETCWCALGRNPLGCNVAQKKPEDQKSRSKDRQERHSLPYALSLTRTHSPKTRTTGTTGLTRFSLITGWSGRSVFRYCRLHVVESVTALPAAVRFLTAGTIKHVHRFRMAGDADLGTITFRTVHRGSGKILIDDTRSVPVIRVVPRARR